MNDSLEEVLLQYFPRLTPVEVHIGLHDMRERLTIAELGLLPRPELAQRAYLALQYGVFVNTLYNTLVEAWGDDPHDWQLPDGIQCALGDILALYFAHENTNHTTDAGVPPVSNVPTVRRARKRGRTGA